jgi:hypothetical protein
MQFTAGATMTKESTRDDASHTIGVWGYTKVEFRKAEHFRNLKPPCMFRDGRRIHPNEEHPSQRGYLFIRRPGFDPILHPEQRKSACPYCLKVLDMEKADEIAGENGEAAKV